jgi:hypothetical protein
VLDAGNQLQLTGRQDEARKAFQEAYNYSQGQADLNEDARVQLRNLVKQQVKVGLVNRRDNNRYQRNKLDLQQMQQMRGFNDDNGNFTTEYAQNVEQRLSPKENTALEQVAEKIIDQQAAAAGVVSSIRITLPEHGRELTFRRPMQIDPAGEVSVVFKTFGEGVARSARDLAVAAAAFLALWAAVRRVYAVRA